MGRADFYKHGSWNAICDRCGFKFKAEKLRLEWTGLRVCHGADTNDCWEARHSQDFVRGKPDNQAPPWVRPEPPDTFVSEFGSAELIGGDALDNPLVPEEVELGGDEASAVSGLTHVVLIQE